MESKLPRTLAELAAEKTMWDAAYVDLPDKSAAILVRSVQFLADEVYTVNQQHEPLFTGFEPVVIYFDVRNFAGVMRELLIHRINATSKGKDYNASFWSAQNDIANLRKRLETAYRSELQKGKAVTANSYPLVGRMPEIWMFGLAAYHLLVEKGRRFDDVFNMSLSKLARLAGELGQPIVERATTEGEVPYYFPKR